MRTLLLSGWAQPANALQGLAEDALAFDYSDYPSITDAVDALREVKADHVIGWSTGGYLALRAIGAGALSPKHLTLIASPHQFVGDEDVKGMDPLTFQLFRASYANDPARTKARFHALTAKGDRDQKRIISQLEHHPDVDNTARWLPWLDELSRHKLDARALASAPPTLIIHGMNDAIVPISQSEHLVRMLPNATLSRWEAVGHAPHLHDPARAISEINAHRNA